VRRLIDRLTTEQARALRAICEAILPGV